MSHILSVIDPFTFIVVVSVRVGRATSLTSLAVVVVTRVACCRHLRTGVASRSALDVALPGLNLPFDRSLDFSDDRSRQSECDRSQEEKQA